MQKMSLHIFIALPSRLSSYGNMVKVESNAKQSNYIVKFKAK